MYPYVITIGAEDRHNMENYESGPESGEITNSDSEAEKRNALIKSLVNVSMENIRILYECQVWIDKSVPRVTFWHHEARRVMPNCDPRDRFVYPYLTRMMDSFSCTL